MKMHQYAHSSLSPNTVEVSLVLGENAVQSGDVVVEDSVGHPVPRSAHEVKPHLVHGREQHIQQRRVAAEGNK